MHIAEPRMKTEVKHQSVFSESTRTRYAAHAQVRRKLYQRVTLRPERRQRCLRVHTVSTLIPEVAFVFFVFAADKKKQIEFQDSAHKKETWRSAGSLSLLSPASASSASRCRYANMVSAMLWLPRLTFFRPLSSGMNLTTDLCCSLSATFDCKNG